jgi:hypothetical protein
MNRLLYILILLYVTTNCNYSIAQAGQDGLETLSASLTVSVNYPHHLIVEYKNNSKDKAFAPPLLEPNGNGFLILSNEGELLLEKDENWVIKDEIGRKGFKGILCNPSESFQYTVLPQIYLKEKKFDKGYYKLVTWLTAYNITSDTISFFFDPEIDYQYGKKKIANNDISIEEVIVFSEPNILELKIKNNTDSNLVIGSQSANKITFEVINSAGIKKDITGEMFEEKFEIPARSEVNFSSQFDDVINEKYDNKKDEIKCVITISGEKNYTISFYWRK